MGIFSTRRADRACAQQVNRQLSAGQTPPTHQDAFSGRAVEFVAVVPAPAPPRPPAPSSARVFVPERAPFSWTPTAEESATGRLQMGPDSYQGSLARGLPSGGTWRFADGGEFEQVAGMRHLALERDSHYFGETQDGIAHGPGMVRWGSGDTYTGEFASGLPCGPGLWRFPDGRCITLSSDVDVERYAEGEWAGSVVYCPTRDDAWHGRGVMQTFTGGEYDSTYCGDFAEGWSSGKGAIYYANGSIYRGEVEEGCREGRGIFQGTWGSLDGQWRDDEFDGHGTSTMVSDDKRIVTTVGDFVKGRCVWGHSECEGSPTWVGPFKVVNGSAVPHGMGCSIDPGTGLEVRAEFENGRFIPPGWRELNGG